MFIVSLVGKNVFQNHVIVCALNNINNMDKVRTIISNEYNIVFSSKPTISTIGYYVYDLVVLGKDIRMVVESTKYICDDSLQ